MELRILYAGISGLTAGISSFLTKISAEKGYNSFQFTGYTFLSASFFALLFFLHSGEQLSNLLTIVLIGMIMGISYTMTVVSRIESLKNISTTLYFPFYKIVSTILAFIVGVSFFTDAIKTNEIIGVIFGLLVPIILINKKEHLKHKNMQKGISLSMISIFFAVITICMSKIINIYDLNIAFYIFIGNVTGGVISLLQYNFKYKKNNHFTKKIKRICIINGLLLTIGSIFFVKAMSGNLGVVYTINSFSILIPIVLSVIIYKDHLDLRKTIAIILTIVSMLFFKVF